MYILASKQIAIFGTTETRPCSNFEYQCIQFLTSVPSRARTSWRTACTYSLAANAWDGKGIHEFLGREEKTLNEKLHCRLAGSNGHLLVVQGSPGY